LMDKKDFKALFLSNAVFSPSGYGTQSNGMLYEWIKQGYNVRQLANYGLQGRQLGLNGLMIYPALEGDIHGDKTARLIFNSWKPNVFFTMYDIWMGAYQDGDPLNPQTLRPIHPYWIPIVMVDHNPVPEQTAICASTAYKVITPTKYGVEELKKKNVQAEYIPFGINPKVWKPQHEDEKRENKKWLQERTVPFNMQKRAVIDEDSFLISINGANKDPYRKAFMRSFLGLQLFFENNPDAEKDTRVYLHSWMRLARDIPHGAKTLQVDWACKAPSDLHMLSGVPDASMARIAGCADVFLHPTQGGGFEIPIMEHMSCGVPAISSNFVGIPEMVKDNGWLIDPVRGENGSKSLYFSPLDATQIICDEYAIADAIEDAYNHPKKVKKLGKKSRKKVLKEFDWKHIHPKYFEILDEVRDEQSYKPLKERML
jgi:glycosyltransferase involved in cell wall biosynthesis